VVVQPGDVQAFIREAEMLRTDPDRCSTMASRARQYAERNFDLDRITDRFEEVFEAALRRRAGGAKA
jgi:glycosyltransferase involved in cell wall biosynthesis